MSIRSSILIRSVASAFLAFGMPAQAEEYNTQTYDIAQVSSSLGVIVQSYGAMPGGTKDFKAASGEAHLVFIAPVIAGPGSCAAAPRPRGYGRPTSFCRPRTP